MLRIHQQLQSGGFPNASTLAASLEVSSKSIHRDLEFMRDRLALPLAYDAIRHGYAYTQPVAAFPTLQISEGELFALLVAEKALQQYRGTTFEQPLLQAFKKIAASLPDTISLNLSEWEQTISFRTSAETILNLEIFDRVAKSMARRQQLRLSYRKPGQSTAESRLVDPYHLANINGEWFLFAFDHLRRAIRTFSPARIQAAEPTGKTFAKPKKFSLDRELRDSFGVHSGHEQHRVVVQFDAAVADYIREKRWHPSQGLKELGGGSVEMELRLSSLSEVERWILGWGGHAKVLSPPRLIESIRHAAREILAKNV